MANNDLTDDLLHEMQQAFGVSSITTGPSSTTTQSTSPSPSPSSETSGTATNPSSASSSRPPFLPDLISHSRTSGSLVPPPPSIPPLLVSNSLPLHSCPPSTKTCSIHPVLLSPDLLPIILSSLAHDPRSLLSLRLVCPLWDSVIRTAPEFKLTFLALPMWKWPAEEFLLLDLGAKGVGRAVTITKAAEVEKGQWIEVSMSRMAAQRILPERKGSGARRVSGVTRSIADVEEEGWRRAQEGWRYEDLFITQPPILGMQAFVDDASSSLDVGEHGDADDNGGGGDESAGGPVCKLSCDAGITLGFLAETTLSLLCGGNGLTSRDSNVGAVEEDVDDSRRVVFKAIMSFCAPKVAVRKRGVVRTVTSFG